MFGHMLNHNSSNTYPLSICHLFVKIHLNLRLKFHQCRDFSPLFRTAVEFVYTLSQCILTTLLLQRNWYFHFAEEKPRWRETLSKAWWTCAFWNEIAGSPSCKIPSYLPLLSALNADLPWDLSSPLPWCDTAQSLISHDRGEATVQSIIPEFHACSLAPKLFHACLLWIFSRQECLFFQTCPCCR